VSGGEISMGMQALSLFVAVRSAGVPLIVTMADLVEPRFAPCAPASATATVLLPVNEVALLIGITKDFGAVSLLPQLSDPRTAV